MVQSNTHLHRHTGQYRVIGGGGATAPYNLDWLDTFEMSSVGHPKRSYSGSGDGGGPWFMDKVTHTQNLPSVDTFFVIGPIAWAGPIGWLPHGDAFPPLGSDLKGQGTKAIAESLPTNSSADLGQFIGELREGAPKALGSGLLKEKTRFLKGSGSEYLNVEFGWKPLVNDLKKFAHAVKHSDKIIESYRANSNKKIRRRYRFPTKTETFTDSGGGVILPTAWSMFGSGTVTQTYSTESWFSGAFKYHIPVGSDAVDKLKAHVSEADKLLGIRLTPETVWNLAPWTWAADWFGNTGDILHNISGLGSDGLLMQYGYMMASATSDTNSSFQFTFDYGGGGGVRTTVGGSTNRLRKIAVRIVASPYGFDLSWDGLSNRQKAIAAAVGVTRR